jgi:YggT family protein
MRELLCTVLNLYVIAIVLRMVLSWFPLEPGGVVAQANGVLRRATDPLLEPLRRALPPLGGLDLSPLIAILGLQIVVGRLILNC